MTRSLKIATRKSPLALWQAEYVRERLRRAHAGLEVELVKLQTQGDRILDAPLAAHGGKGLFVKALEQGLLDGRADIAVHSMKDVPTDLPAGLELAVICRRGSPLDALVSPRYGGIAALPHGASVGSASLRRRSQLLALRPDLAVRDARGNVHTRLARLERGDFDALILACAGLIRLGLESRIRARLTAEVMLPAAGQGAIGIECRADDRPVQALIAPLRHTETGLCVAAERAFSRRLGGGCHAPVAAFACLKGGALWLRGLAATPDGARVLRGDMRGSAGEAEALGAMLADDLLRRGAGGLFAAP